MTSVTAICNRALTKLGDSRILDITDDNKQARTMNSMFTIVRDAELRARVWNFSKTRVSLAADIDTPAWGYDYQYSLPSDCLRVLQIGQYYPLASLTDYMTGDERPYSIESGKILANDDGPLDIIYVSSVADVSLWDSCFCEVMAAKLALEACETLTQSNTKRQLAERDYVSAVTAAIRSNALEVLPVQFNETSWVMSRL